MHATLAALTLLAAPAVVVSDTSYVGGWETRDTCVDICAGIANNDSYPFETSVYEHLYTPGFCNYLENGIDLTITHQDVSNNTEGIRCREERVSKSMMIHGLWPGWKSTTKAGYMGCCNSMDESIGNQPLDVEVFEKEHRLTHTLMQRFMVDPTQKAPTHHNDTSMCQMVNHEFQKHGYCFVRNPTTTGDIKSRVADAAAKYFAAVLAVDVEMLPMRNLIDDEAEFKGHTTVDKISKTMTKRATIWCEPQTNTLAAIRTCWDVVPDSNLVGAQIDCDVATPKDTTDAPAWTESMAPCATDRPVKL